MKLFKTFLILFIALFASNIRAQKNDSEQLGMALEYFTSGKFHESLLIFQELDVRHKLNPRFKAYIGICHYHEWNYKQAVEYLDSAIPQLEGMAPHERSVYYFAAGESHFQLRNYEQAITYYERVLEVCYESEKGETFYRLGLAHMFLEHWQAARDNYILAQIHLTSLLSNRETSARLSIRSRLSQISRMIAGCEQYIHETSK